VGTLGQYSSKPSETHWQAGMEVLRYLSGTLNFGLIFKGSDNFKIIAYADSDWAADRETGRSVYGYAVYVGGNLVSWKSKKSQTQVATSSTIAEVEALYHAVTECEWIMGLLLSIGVISDKSFIIYQDNKAVIAIMTSERALERTKT
jgi:hypothetical protein